MIRVGKRDKDSGLRHLGDLIDAPFGRFGAWLLRDDARRWVRVLVADVDCAQAMIDRKSIIAVRFIGVRGSAGFVRQRFGG